MLRGGSSVQRTLLYVLVASVIAATIVGIAFVLREKWGWFEVRVILTTITLAIASTCGLACDFTRTARGRNVLPISGLILTVASAALILALMWADVDGEVPWKITACVTIFAVATTHLCLLTIAQLPRRTWWLMFGAYQIIYGLAVLSSGLILWEDNIPDRAWKIVAALGIAAAAISAIIPMLARVAKIDATTKEGVFDERNLEQLDAEISRLSHRLAELNQRRRKMMEIRTCLAAIGKSPEELAKE